MTVTGLEAGTTYEFHVVAYDAAGLTSGPSNVVRLTISGAEYPGSDLTDAWGAGGGSGSGVGTQSSVFDTRLSLVNPTLQAARATILLRPAAGAPASSRAVTVPPLSHADVGVASMLGGRDSSFGVEVASSAPIGVSRTVTFDGGIGGHSELATAVPARRWYFAEGATHGRFELFYLLFNPGTSPATVSMTYMLPSGRMAPRYHEVAPQSRLTVWVDQEGPALANTDLAVVIESISGPAIVAERVMWWPGTNWQDGHASSGAAQTAARWLAVGAQHDGAQGHVTYLLAANTSASPQTARVTVLGTNGPQVATTVEIPGRSRHTIDMAAAFPSIQGTYSVLVEAVGGEGQLVVEHSVYWDAVGQRWAAGTATPGLALDQ